MQESKTWVENVGLFADDVRWEQSIVLRRIVLLLSRCLEEGVNNADGATCICSSEKAVTLLR